MESLTARNEVITLARTRPFAANKSVKHCSETLSTKEIMALNGIIGKDPALIGAIEMTLKVSKWNVHVFITGRTGTGKEQIARLIKWASNTPDEKYVVKNCGSLNPNLIGSELFGHSRGAFTGAIYNKKGPFEYANGGIVFLDEITALSSDMQEHLLRVAETGEFSPVGCNEVKVFNGRLITAASNLEEKIDKGEFREDFFHRISTICINLPSLRERKGDIPLLAAHFLTKMISLNPECRIKGFSEAAIKKLKDHAWEGNIRELRNIIERAVIVCRGNLIDEKDVKFNQGLTISRRIGEYVGKTIKEAEDDFKRIYIMANLKEFGGNRATAAKTMGIQRTYLQKLISKHNLKGKV